VIGAAAEGSVNSRMASAIGHDIVVFASSADRE
jgi:hypothetical protein